SRKNHRVFPHAERYELSLAAEFPKIIKCPLVRFRCASRQYILAKKLPCKRRGPGGQRLLGSRDFARNSGRWIFAVFNRKERLSIHPIEHINEPLLGRLRYGV